MADMDSYIGGFYMSYLESLCRRRGWHDPQYDCRRGGNGFSCLVTVNGREYQTDLTYESGRLAQENAAMRAFMVCSNFSVNGGMLARNGVVQGLPATAINDVVSPTGTWHRNQPRHPAAVAHAHSSRPHSHQHRPSHGSASSFDDE